MPTLTWRDVAAPDFNTSLGATALAGRSLNNAFGGLSDSLGKFHDWQQQQAASALANNEVQYPDAQSQAAAAAGGALFNGVDRSNLTPDALKGVDSRATTLLNNAMTQAQLPYAGDLAKANVNSINAGTGQTNLNTKITGNNYDDLNSAAKVTAQITPQATNFDEASALLEAQRGSLTPGAYSRAMEALQSKYAPGAAGNPNGAAGAIAGAAGGTSGSGNLISDNAGFIASIPPGPYDQTRNYVNKIVPNLPDLSGMDNDAKAAAIMSALKNQESSGQQIDPKTGQTITSSKGAKGIAQVMPATFAELKAAHPDIKGDINDQASNELAGQYYLKDQLDHYNGNVPQALAAYNAGPHAVDKWLANSPNAMLEAERNAQMQATALTSKAGQFVGQNTAPGIAGQYTELQKDNTPMADVVAGLKGQKDGQFSTIDPDLIRNPLNKILDYAAQAKVPMNPATAAALLNRYGSYAEGGWLHGNPGRNSINLNDAGVKAEIANMADPDGLATKSVQNNAATALSQSVQAAQAQQQAAFAAVQQGQQRAALHPDYAGLPALQTKYNRAKELLSIAVGNLQKQKLVPTYPGRPGSSNAASAISGAVAPASNGFNN